MPKNPFVQHSQFTPKFKRNSDDMSFQNNLSMPIGALVPVMCLEAHPGDSFRVKAGAYLRAMPTVFPVQTPVRYSLHIFKVYNRTLWKDWGDFIYNNDSELEHPYLDPGAIQRNGRPGTLYDYLGIPVNFYSSQSRKVEIRFQQEQFYQGYPLSNLIQDYKDSNFNNLSVAYTSLVPNTGSQLNFGDSYYYKTEELSYSTISTLGDITIPIRMLQLAFPGASSSASTRYTFESRFVLCVACELEWGSGSIMDLDSFVYVSEFDGKGTPDSRVFDVSALQEAVRNFHNNLVSSEIAATLNFSEKYYIFVAGFGFSTVSGVSDDGIATVSTTGSYPASLVFLHDYFYTGYMSYYSDYSGGVSLDAGLVNPFSRKHLSSLPFRAYEAIYNSFYRDTINDPWYLDGKPQYNNYITTHDGGLDSTPYHLFYRNWEKDFLTSAYPSPQQGLAPLVGITSRGNLKFEMPDGTIKEVRATFDKEGVIDGYELADAKDDDLLRASVNDAVNQGISINDLRQVGAMQRWLETNMRRGFRYRDQVKAHTGVSIDFDELDMPEFLGGYSRVVNTAQINQTVDGGSGSPLGSYAGQLSFFNGMDHSVSTFFKEHGFLIAIACITPVPAYSQLLPKMYLKDNPLSYYSPEFGHIGMQPISYAEVCPLQVVNDPGQRHQLDDTFGYQRPWYDLISKTDEVHGLLRTQLRDMIMNRTFDGVPELNSPEFLHIQPDQVNQVFASTQPDEHNFFGMIVFDIQKKTSVPRSGIPMLNA